MDDRKIIERISALVEEEDRLHNESEPALDADGQRRLAEVRDALDVCWDVLRQRRARRRVGADPDEAGPRDVQDYVR